MADGDVHDYSSSSHHRLPTLSASQALQNLSSSPARPISTGLSGLDAYLQGMEISGSQDSPDSGGVTRGQITEVFGPPGVGKTAFAVPADGRRMQVASNALRAGSSVVWVDTTSRFVLSRLRDMLERPNDASLTPESSVQSDVLAAEKQIQNLTHFALPTLAHLMALLAPPSDSFPPSNTSLLVVDNISTLFALAFPKLIQDAHKQQPAARKHDASQFASGRRWAVMADLISRLGRLAVTRNIAILLLGQTTTRVRSDTGAVLCPAISGTGCEGGIDSRIVLYRDWLFLSKDLSSQAEHCPGVRFVGIMKAKGITYENLGRTAAFTIQQAGLQEIKLDKSQLRCQITAETMVTNPKRKRDEIADSESEDEDARSDREFGWGAEDETMQAEQLL